MAKRKIIMIVHKSPDKFGEIAVMVLPADLLRKIEERYGLPPDELAAKLLRAACEDSDKPVVQDFIDFCLRA